MILRCIMPAIALLLLSCAAVPEPKDADWQKNYQGAFMLQEDGSILQFDGVELNEIDKDGNVVKLATISNQASPGQFHSMSGDQSDIIPGPDKSFLWKGFSFGNTGSAIVVPSGDPEMRMLEVPSGLLQQHSFRVSNDDRTRMCWLGDKAVVLHWNQLAMAYAMDGKVLWEYMMDDSSGLLAGPDGDRVLLTDVQGNMVCLNDNGESIWERSGLLRASQLDNRIICISSDYQEIACIDWNGEDIWSIPGMSDGIGYVYYAVDEFEPQFLLVKQAEYECRDAEGKLKWKRNRTQDIYSQKVYFADGYIFEQFYEGHSQASWMGGRLRPVGSYHSGWSCLAPDGSMLWRSKPGQNYNQKVMPARNGRLYYWDYQGMFCFAGEQ